MKVPVLDASVRQGPSAPTYNPDLVRPDNSMSQAVGQVGKALVSAAETADKYYFDEQNKAVKEGRALTVAEASLKSENEWAGRALEFKKLKGTQASEGRAKAFEDMETARRKTAEGIADEGARREYLIRSAERLAAWQRQVDSHTLTEFDNARDETLKARMGQALGAAEAGDVKSTHSLQAQVEADIQATHPDAAPALIEKFRQDIALKKFEVTLRGGNVDSAKAFLESDAGKKSLGIHAEEANDMLVKAKAAYDKSVAKVEAEGLAGAILKDSMKPDGYLDGAKAEAAIMDTPLESRVYVRTLIKEQIAADAKRYKADFGKLKSQARMALTEGRSFAAIPAETLERLNSYEGGADYVRNLQRDAESMADRAKRMARGTGTSKKQAEKEQERANKLALEHFGELTRAQQAEMDLDDWVVGRGVDELGRATLGRLRTQSKEHVEKDGGRAADAFTRFAKKTGEELKFLPRGKNKGLDEDAQRAYLSEAQEAFDAWVKEHNGKPPSADEQRQIIDELAVKGKKGWFEWFKKDRYEFQERADARAEGGEAATPAPRAKPVTPAKEEPAPASGPFGTEKKMPDGTRFRRVGDKWVKVK